MFLLNTNNYFRVRFRVRVSVLLNTFTPQFSVGEPAVRINSDILVSAKLQARSLQARLCYLRAKNETDTRKLQLIYLAYIRRQGRAQHCELESVFK